MQVVHNNAETFDQPNCIVVSGLQKSYGPVKAVNGIDFTVKRGEIFGMLGPNGAGKTPPWKSSPAYVSAMPAG